MTVTADARPVIDPAGPMTGPQRRKLMALAGLAALSRQDRLDLSAMILRREMDSWRDLTVREASRLIDGIEAHLAIAELHAQAAPVATNAGTSPPAG